MRTFSSEFAHNYGSYSFGYCNYALRESGDPLSTLYQAGYLPYSGSHDVHETFYMARSTRIHLPGWEPNSENRRVMRLHDTVFERTEHAIGDFKTDDSFRSFCLSYFERHHGAHTMPPERLDHILTEGALTTIVSYAIQGSPAAYVLLPQDAHMSHVWFSFYAPELAQQSFGMWVLLNEARQAQAANREYFYLGTAYGDKSRYKMNFSSLEFWDGTRWLQDRDNSEVRSRTKNDALSLTDFTDVFKKDKENFF